MLNYLVRNKNPLACLSAMLMAVRAEIRLRNKRLPTAVLEVALVNLQKLQVGQLTDAYLAHGAAPGPR